MIDTPWALLRKDNNEVKRLKRERDEALALAEERKTYWDSEYRAYEDMRSLWHAALRERDEARSERQAGYAKAERAEKMLRTAAAKADEWRECAEKLADAFRGVPYDPFSVGAVNAQTIKEALLEYKRLKEGGK
jgi:hypothetical protein